MSVYECIIEEIIKKQIELGNDRFVIYPAGEMGTIVKKVLNQKLGIKEIALVDNHITNSENPVISFKELSEVEDWYVLLLSVRNEKAKKEIISGLKGILRPIVDVFYEYDEHLSGIFDFNCPKMIINDVDSAQMSKLFERTSSQWSKLGNTEPYWSVLTHDNYLSHNITGQEIKKFYETGEQQCKQLIQTLIRNERIEKEEDACQLEVTEIGCGCGRVTASLGTKFKHVYAYDISPGNMRIAQKYITSSNVEFKLIESFEEYDNLPETDVIFSVLVLQHNVPPIIKYMLSKMMHSLRSNGIAVFQVPSYLRGYRFSYDEWIGIEYPMDMHVLPQKDIFKIIKDEGCDLLECYMDYYTGKKSGYISSTYVVIKR